MDWKICPHCGFERGVHAMMCPRAGGPIAFDFDGLFCRDVAADSDAIAEERAELIARCSVGALWLALRTALGSTDGDARATAERAIRSAFEQRADDRPQQAARATPAWTTEWPTETGLYLFYGGFVDPDGSVHHARMQLCTVARVANGLAYMTASHFMFRSEQAGVFCALGVDEPDLSRYGIASDPEGE